MTVNLTCPACNGLGDDHEGPHTIAFFKPYEDEPSWRDLIEDREPLAPTREQRAVIDRAFAEMDAFPIRNSMP